MSDVTICHERSTAEKNYSCWRLLWCFWCGILPFFFFYLETVVLDWIYDGWTDSQWINNRTVGDREHENVRLSIQSNHNTCYSFYSHTEVEKTNSFQWLHGIHISPAVTLHWLNNSMDSCCFYLMSWTWNLLLYMKWVVFVLKLYNHICFIIGTCHETFKKHFIFSLIQYNLWDITL